MAYTKKEKEKALNLFLDEVPIAEIARRENMPSSNTLYKWRDDGEITNGIPWDEYREEQRNTEMMQAKAESLQESVKEGEKLWEVVDSRLGNVALTLISKLEEGNYKASIGDLNRLLKLKARIKNQDQQVKHFMEEFTSMVFHVAIDIMSEQQFAKFKAKVMEEKAKREQELNPLDDVEVQDVNR